MKNINRSYLILLTLIGALGGLLFGFDIAIITGAGPFIEVHFGLSKISLGWAFSSLLFGCMLGSFAAGRITDLIGRRRILFFVAVLFAVTCAGTGLATGFTMFIVFRFLGGLAVGAASIISPMYIAEVSPPSTRGSLVSVYQLSIVTGIVTSYLINYLLRDVDNNWRWMFMTGVIPSAIFFILLFFVPETPRYLYKAGRHKQSYDLLKKINGSEEADKEIRQIRETLKVAKSGYRDLLKPEYRKFMVLGFWLAVLVQISGINAIIDYAPIIFKTAGWGIDAALFATFGLGINNVIFTFVSILAVDKVGRKTLYIIGSSGMTLSLGALAILHMGGNFTGLPVLIACLVFLAFFAGCIGPVFWTLVSEIFPNKIRGTAMSIPVLTQWFFNGLLVLLFPWFLHNYGTISFAFLSLMSLVQLLFTIRYVPETKGKTLEEIEQSWGLAKSTQ